MKKSYIAALSALCLMAAPAVAAEKIKIGVITTLSGPGGAVGSHLRDGANLAFEQLGGKIGGVDAELIYGDDQQKPDVGRQVAEQMLKRDRVDFITGVLWSHVLLSVYQSVIRSDAILVSVSAGPSQVAGKLCAPNFFSTGWQNDQPAEAMGKYMTDQNIQDVYVMMPNFAAGRDIAQGFKRYYKGNVVGEVYTRLDQTDYQTEISQLRASGADAAFVFYAGGVGIQFFKQLDQAGLRGSMPIYSVFSLNEVILPAVGDTVVGNYESDFWSPDLKNPTNDAFVAEFRKKYNYVPSGYAATAYDSIRMIDSAVGAVKGNVEDKKAVIAEMEKANFESVRGNFSYNTNHFPIQDFYLFKIAQDADGNYIRKLETVLLEDHKDAYYTECAMN